MQFTLNWTYVENMNFTLYLIRVYDDCRGVCVLNINAVTSKTTDPKHFFAME